MGKSKKPDLKFPQNYMESREVGEGDRDQTRLILSLYLLKLLMDTRDSLFLSLYFCICLNFSIISFSKIPGFNYFPAGVNTPNMEIRMFIFACILQALYFINIYYFHKILITTSFLQELNKIFQLVNIFNVSDPASYTLSGWFVMRRQK